MSHLDAIGRALPALAVLSALLLVGGGESRAALDDVLVLDNGDTLTGQIKELARGRLRFKTPSTDSIYVDWEYVAGLTSRDRYDIELTDGSEYFGSLEGDPVARVLDIVTADGIITVPLLEVVYITPIEDGFWKRIDGNVDWGFSFTSSTRLLQYSLTSNATYRSENWSAALTLDSIFTDQRDVDTKTRDDLNLRGTRFLGKKRLLSAFGQLQRNEDLGFDLRTLASLSVGLSTIQTNNQSMVVAVGLSAQREDLVNSVDSVESLELVAALTYENFRYHKPKRDISISFIAYPSLTATDRVRVELSAKLRIEVVSDLHIGLSLLESYDSNPPTEGADKNDTAVILSLGYTF